MGIATAVEDAVVKLLVHFVNTKSAELCAILKPVALTGTTIYLLIMGYAVMRGDAQDPLHTVLWKWFKITMIASIALDGGQYQGMIVNGMEGIEGALIGAFGNATTVGGVIDQMATPYELLGQKLWSAAGTGVLTKFSLLAAAGMVALAQAFLVVVGLGMYLLAKVSLSLILAVGPVFILCAMFPATQRFTESWLSQVLSFILLNVLVVACITMLTDFAGTFAGKVNDSAGATAVMRDTLALLIASVSLGVVLLNVNTIASALSGGASLQGIGRDVANGLSSLLKQRPKKGGGSIERGNGEGGGNAGSWTPGRPGGGTSSAGTGSGSSQPLYLRNVVDNIRRAAK